MAFDVKQDVVKIVIPSDVPENHPYATAAALMQSFGTGAQEVFDAEGFEKVELVEKPFTFFVHSQSNALEREKQFSQYLITLRAVCYGGVTLPEQQKHARMINLYHDMFTHVLPTDTRVDFSPTITIAAITGQI